MRRGMPYSRLLCTSNSIGSIEKLHILRYNKQKREEMMEHIVRAMTTAEVLQKSVARMEGKYEQYDQFTVLKTTFLLIHFFF